MDDGVEVTFEGLLVTARPTAEQLQKTMLVNLTTRPNLNPSSLALMWMQCDQVKWAGYHPEKCLPVAEGIGIVQDT